LPIPINNPPSLDIAVIGPRGVSALPSPYPITRLISTTTITPSHVCVSCCPKPVKVSWMSNDHAVPHTEIISAASTIANDTNASRLTPRKSPSIPIITGRANGR
jgi:hypothetical protein